MKKRTASQRNFIGAFLGGILGILAFGYLHPVVLPFGCFFGVIIGWWYREIWQSIADTVPQSITRMKRFWSRFIIFILTPAKHLKKLKFDLSPEAKFVHFVLFSVVWLVRRPIFFVRWLRTHQMNCVYILRTFSIILYAVLNALWAIPFVICWFKAIDGAPRESVMPFLFMLGVMAIAAVITVGPFVFLPGSYMPRMQKFYHDWENYAKYGPLRFFLKDLTGFFLCEISTFLFLAGVLIWFTSAGGIFVVLVVTPISVLIGAVKAIFRVVTKKGHWLCFGVTVVITGFSAWLTNPYFDNVRILWAVALLTGIASGIATEAVRRFLVWFFKINKKAYKLVITPLAKSLTPSGQLFWRITVKAGKKFSEALPTFSY
jgi:hypothetical protein